MKKNLVYILIAVVLAAAVGYVVWKDRNADRPADDQNFVTPGIEDITHIFIAAKDGRTITLDKKKDEWIVNDTFKAMPAKVDFLLSTLKSFVIYSPVPTAARDNAVKELATHGIKVELYENNRKKPLKVFFVGKPNQGQTANHMLMQIDGKSAKEPYLVHIPGFIGDIQTRFLLNETDWRDLNIFDQKLDDIKEVSIIYHDVTGASLIITTDGDGNYTLQQPESNTTAPKEQLFTAGINKFLDSFGNLNAEAVENGFIYKDSIINGPKFATITVTTKVGEKTQMVLYRMPTNRRTKTQFDTQGNAIPFDPDYYYAVFNDGQDFGIVQHFVFGKVLRKYSDFLVKDKPGDAAKQ